MERNRRLLGFAILLGLGAGADAGSLDQDAAFELLAERINAPRKSFSVYDDADSAFNHGFPSGFFGTVDAVSVDAACIDAPIALTGCATDVGSLDLERGTVIRIRFNGLTGVQYAGVNFEEPENWGTDGHVGAGFDLTGATHIVFDARSPDLGGAKVQFGFAGGTLPYTTLGSSWQTFSIPLALFAVNEPLSDVNLLFSVATNAAHELDGATILLDRIRFEPVPLAQQGALGLPLGTETFGVIPASTELPGRVPIPPDQVLRNLATIYESAMAVFVLLDRGESVDRTSARIVLDAFHYALANDNAGLPLPTSASGARGLHSGYSGGDLALHNGQGAASGQAGDVRLSGFTASASLCGASKFCVVLDGATGGNVAFAILALLAGYGEFGDETYLDDARTLATWIFENLRDPAPDGFRGYFLGYEDEGKPPPKPLVVGKSVENNADIFAAFWELAEIEQRLGRMSDAAAWRERARYAGDFVIEMFDESTGCFFAGTVPAALVDPQPGIEPSEEARGNERINEYLFLDANTFTTLALAGRSPYRDAIDWRAPVECTRVRFGRAFQLDDQVVSGFGLIETTYAGPDGVAWEFTAQVPVLMRYVDDRYHQTAYAAESAAILESLGAAQSHGPNGDLRGLVAATLEGGSALPPREQCLTTPFQCIPQRVGLAATTWALAADRGMNPLPEPAAAIAGVVALAALGIVGAGRAFWGRRL